MERTGALFGGEDVASGWGVLGILLFCGTAELEKRGSEVALAGAFQSIGGQLGSL
jgi:hypothetical protein